MTFLMSSRTVSTMYITHSYQKKMSLSNCNTRIHTQIILKLMLHTQNTGTIYVWGRNDSGQLGTGDRLNRYSPKLLDIGTSLCILDIACGRSHSAVAFDQGILYVFGSNQFSQCGIHDTKNDILSPKKIQLADQDWAEHSSSSKKTLIGINSVVAGFTQTVLSISTRRVK